MNLLTDEDVRRVARRAVRDAVAMGAARADAEASFPSESIRAVAAAGLLGLLVPEEYGGAGLGIRELAAAADAIAPTCASTALITVAHAAACSAISAAASPDLRSRLLPELAAGRLLAGFAVHELSSGCMASPIETRAIRDGDGFRLSGTKPFVTAGGQVDLIVVLANLDPSGPSLLAVDTHLAGVSCGRPEGALGLRGTAVTEVVLDNCLVPHEALIGKGGDGLPILRDTIGVVGRFGTAGAALGIARAIRAAAFEHVRARSTGGLTLGERPAVVSLAADISLAVDAVEAVLAWYIRGAEQRPDQAPTMAMKAKLFATERAVEVARDALQITGGQGFFGAMGIERFLRDALGLTVHLGPSALLREEVGRSEVSPKRK